MEGNSFCNNDACLISDRDSFFAHLLFSPNTRHVDNKRLSIDLSIDLSSLKQLIWDNRDDCDEEVDGDEPQRIQTSSMLSDYLTKTVNSCDLSKR